MTYELDTIQYGEFKDTHKHKTLKSLLSDIYNIHECFQSYQITEIRKKGKPISKTRMRIFQSIAHE